MAPPQVFLFLLLTSSLPHMISSIENNCPVSYCGNLPFPIKFPFQITNSHHPSNSTRCVYPGFELSCHQNQTLIITIKHSGQFVVRNINYNFQTLWVDDPNQCLPNRLLNVFTVKDTPFCLEPSTRFTFVNCSSLTPDIATTRYGHKPISCLSGGSYSVLGMRSYNIDTLPSSCVKISNDEVTVPMGLWSGLEDYIRLMWIQPFCASCEDRSQGCGFKSDSGFDTRCSNLSNSAGISRSTKYGKIIGVGIPGMLCIFGIGYLLFDRVSAINGQRHRCNTQLSTSIAPQLVMVLTGLEEATIESYPKTLLGESGRLPKPNDNTCPICLSEYKPKETLRTLPDCTHYFHANCIDEWLRINSTCLLCRNSPY